MNIELSKEQYRELLIDTAIGAYIREALAEARDEPDFHRMWDIVDYLATLAKDFRSEDMVMKVDGEVMLSDHIVLKEVHTPVEEFVDEEMWDRLVEELAGRDLAATLTPHEKLEFELNEVVPDRAELFFQKYQVEFEEHGLERLQIVESKET